VGVPAGGGRGLHTMGQS